MKRLNHHLHHIAADEKGTMLPYAIAGIFIIALIGYILIGYLGEGYDENRQAKTAADAAALASAEAWGHQLKTEYTKALTSKSPPEFWSHFGRPLAQTKGMANIKAAEYAKNNDTTVTSVNYDSRTATVKVTVQGDDQIKDTGEKVTATATATVVFESGVCNSDGKLGFSIKGACIDSPTSMKIPNGFDYTNSLKGLLPKTRTRLTRESR